MAVPSGLDRRGTTRATQMSQEHYSMELKKNRTSVKRSERDDDPAHRIDPCREKGSAPQPTRVVNNEPMSRVVTVKVPKA